MLFPETNHWLALVVILLLAGRSARADELPRVFSVAPAEIAQVKKRLVQGDAALRPGYEQLLHEADTALKLKPVSVLDRTKIAASGDRHDYLSFAPYFWPNPQTADGLPYINKDGHRNRDLVADGDAPHFEKLLGSTNTLALAFYLSGRESYAKHAALLLRTWFLDSKTRMNPNFTHAQAIPGRTTGRGIGLIEFRGMYHLVDALGLLETSQVWTKQDRQAMRQWLGEYWQWLQSSKNAKEERATTNNHGVWFDVQATALALYLGKDQEAKEICERFKIVRIAAQIRPDGQMPRETARADGWSYTLFNLNALVVMACLAQRMEMDLWHYQGPEGQGIRKAIDYAVPFLDPERPWPFKQLNERRGDGLILPLICAERVYGVGTYKTALNRLGAAKVAKNRAALLYAR